MLKKGPRTGSSLTVVWRPVTFGWDSRLTLPVGKGGWMILWDVRFRPLSKDDRTEFPPSPYWIQKVHLQREDPWTRHESSCVVSSLVLLLVFRVVLFSSTLFWPSSSVGVSDSTEGRTLLRWNVYPHQKEDNNITIRSCGCRFLRSIVAHTTLYTPGISLRMTP